MLVIIPVLGRPQNAEPVVRSLAESIVEVPCRPVFVCNVDDVEQIAACAETFADLSLVPWTRGTGDYARKINAVVRDPMFDEPWIFQGADDLRFHPGWADVALELAHEAGVGVIGTNDLGNPGVMRGNHSTHTLISRHYVEMHGTIDEPGKVLHEGYDHQFIDNELVETAKFRGEWAFASGSHVEHLHPLWRKSPKDATYEIAQAGGHEDRALYVQRRQKWS